MAAQPAPIIPVDGVTAPQASAVQFAAPGTFLIFASSATFIPAPTMTNVAPRAVGYPIG